MLYWSWKLSSIAAHEARVGDVYIVNDDVGFETTAAATVAGLV